MLTRRRKYKRKSRAKKPKYTKRLRHQHGGGKINPETGLKYNRCSPKPQKNKSYSCFSDGGLRTLRDKFNIKHANKKINTDDPREIWNYLHENLPNCNDEICWTKQLETPELTSAFAPLAPSSWKKNPNEWLSTNEFLANMKQFERAFKNFKFIGPSPIDYDALEKDGKCVWEDLCKFNLSSMIDKGIEKIGIVFNLDTHDKPGSHWVSMFINIKQSIVYYFDSVGETCPSRIKKFANTVIKQGSDLGINFRFDQNHPVEHQYGSTECGMYALFFIIHMLREKIDGNYMKTHIISDEHIQKYRHILFN